MEVIALCISLLEIREDLRMIAQTLDKRSERAAREVKGIKTEVTLAMVQVEESLRRAADQAKAWLKVIEAKRELALARIAMSRSDLITPESRVESALNHLREARSLTVDYAESVNTMQEQAQDLLVAIRTKADTVKAVLGALIENSNRLLNEMSSRAATARLRSELRPSAGKGLATTQGIVSVAV